MSQTKPASKRKRAVKAAVPALGAAGLGFSMIGASAATMPAADAPKTVDLSATHPITLSEEEIADVSLSTFHLFDKENAGNTVQTAWRGCGGCRGCRGCGCRGCRGCRCGGCGGCGGCCISWGACRLC
ncbi:conserved exported hypothetical protein [Bradyrhizobium sp. STM 3843]|nr:conserved exported hypothetical protein [Bradyrhizobium sp. STM 3843]